MTKIMNDPESVVLDSLRGMQQAHPELVVVNESPLFVRRAGIEETAAVRVISGGGSGHEPLHAGFVGVGMLDAAVPGPVFTSPSLNQVVAAARAVTCDRGILFLVKNYTGDVMNFEAAAEELADMGIVTRTVIIADDVAIAQSEATAGRRGVAGTVFVEKIAGAAAARGLGLDEVADLARQAADRVRSIGVAVRSGSLFHSPAPTFDLPDGEIEIGIGIHGEPGRWRGAALPASELVATMLDAILAEIDSANEPMLVLVNGMGATSLAELYVAYNEVAAGLAARNVGIAGSVVGNFVTSIDMAGFSISLLPVSPELLDLWNAPVATPAFGGSR